MENQALQMLRNLVRSDDNVLMVRKLLKGGIVKPNIEDSERENLLHAAVQSTEDNERIVKELIHAGADVNRGNCFLYRPLHIAVIYRKRRVVKALLQSRILINSKDSWGKTALHYAINNKLPRTVRFRDVPMRAHVPDLWIIRKLLDHKHINVNQADVSLETPLMQAVKDKQLEIVKLFLNYGSRLDFANKYGQTPLHIALYHKDPCPYIIVMLLLKRATVLKMNSNDRTPLDIIIRTESLDSACLCLKIIAFNYNIHGLLMNKLLKYPILLQFLENCYRELKQMKLDNITNEVTVYDFFAKRARKSGFRNPILKIYKPVVERLVVGLYPEYFCFMLHRISKSNLSLVLRVLIVEIYGKSCDVENYKKRDFTGFLEVLRMGLLNDYLSSFDIFCLIIAVSRAKIDESLLNICHQDCYLTDLWEGYPDNYFH